LRFSAGFVSQKATKRMPGNLRFRGRLSMRFANDADAARRIFERHQAELALMITDLTPAPQSTA
jgi:hypothetical protein